MKLRIMIGAATLAALAVIITSLPKGTAYPPHPADLRDGISSYAAPGAKKFCYQTKKGCETISSLYVSRRWSLKQASPRDLAAGALKYYQMGGYGMEVYELLLDAAMNAKKEFTGSYLKSELQENCGKVNITRNRKLDEAACVSWFNEGLELKQDITGETSSDGDNVIVIVPAKISGNDSYKKYKDEGKNKFNMELQVTCSRKSGLWRTDSFSLRVDHPYSETNSKSFQLSLGGEFAGVGIGASGSVSHSTTQEVPYGDTVKLDNASVLCGSYVDAEDQDVKD